jgi:hypothetical protein
LLSAVVQLFASVPLFAQIHFHAHGQAQVTVVGVPVVQAPVVAAQSPFTFLLAVQLASDHPFPALPVQDQVQPQAVVVTVLGVPDVQRFVGVVVMFCELSEPQVATTFTVQEVPLHPYPEAQLY